MMMTQRRLIRALDHDLARGFDPLHPRRRPQVIRDRVGPREALRADHLFVKEAFGAEARLHAVGRMSFLRDASEGLISHVSPPLAF